MKKRIQKACAVAMSMALAASSLCIVPDAKAAPKTKQIKLNTKKKTLTVGQKITLKVKSVKPAKASKKVTWKSSKKSVATVSSKRQLLNT